MTVTDHARIVTGCISLGAGGDPPSQKGVEVTTTNPTSTNLEVVWPVPELCDYDPTSLSLWRTREGYLLQVDRLAHGDEPQACRAALGRRTLQLALAKPVDVRSIENVQLADGVGIDSVEVQAGGPSVSLTLSSGRAEYSAGEPIDVRGILSHDGPPGQTITLRGSGSGPVIFAAEQVDGQLTMHGGDTDDCASFELTAGEPLSLPFQKGRGWPASDPNTDFYREWALDPQFTLPSGTWRISAYSNFHVGGCESAPWGDSIDLATSIVITVR